MDILGLAEVPGWLLTIFLLILSLYLYSKYKLSFWSRLGVPHPKPTLFLGHAKLMKDGIGEFDLKMLSTHGRVVGTYALHRPTLLILDPELARDILIKDFFKIPNRSQMFKRHDDLDHSLTRLTEDKWRFMRNTISPIFSSGKMRKISPVLTESCARLLKNVENETSQGRSIEFRGKFGNFTMDAIATIGFGIHLDAYEEENSDFIVNAKAIFDNFIGFGVKLNAFMPPLYRLLCKLGVDVDRQSKHVTFFKGLLEQVTKLRGDQQDRVDILQLLLNAHRDTEVSDTEELLEYEDKNGHWKKRGLSKEEVNGNSVLFMIVGYETTATTLAFAAYCLATNPKCQEKLIMEIDSTIGQETPDYDNIQKMEYLDCVIKETLRLYPTVQRTMRETHQEMEIAGYTIPPNTPVSVPIYAFHRSSKYWEEPEVFNPERFLEKNKSKLTPYTYLPFGLGPRICIAMRLAYMEAKCALITIVQKYKFIPCEQTEIPLEVDGRFLLRPKNGIVLKLEKRETRTC
ncbi:cytochrome P450 3A12-like [Ostrea edulis]|uniref:cytochrome P450 3A12-like n=1 Tax=Ostrea edulis TaxID=37623 RepID=UPI0024AEC8D9|nr:cytochrome P450 3A12-like [Ostrea edulis]